MDDTLGAAAGEHAFDVFDEREPRLRLDDDAPRVAPEVALVVFAEAAAGEGMRLTRDAANDSIHEATPFAASEGGHIAPHRRLSQDTRLHRCDQVRDGEGFPLDHNDAAQAWGCQLKSEVEAAAAGAEADAVEVLGT
jgi:hypothetical protein